MSTKWLSFTCRSRLTKKGELAAWLAENLDKEKFSCFDFPSESRTRTLTLKQRAELRQLEGSASSKEERRKEMGLDKNAWAPFLDMDVLRGASEIDPFSTSFSATDGTGAVRMQAHANESAALHVVVLGYPGRKTAMLLYKALPTSLFPPSDGKTVARAFLLATSQNGIERSCSPASVDNIGSWKAKEFLAFAPHSAHMFRLLLKKDGRFGVLLAALEVAIDTLNLLRDPQVHWGEHQAGILDNLVRKLASLWLQLDSDALSHPKVVFNAWSLS